MLSINHAILHAFDFETGAKHISQRELDLADKATKSYVQRFARKVAQSPESRHGTFEPDSVFAERIRDYFAGNASFVDLVEEVALWFWEELRKSDGPGQCDLLAIDFEQTVDLKTQGGSSSTQVGAAMAQAYAAADAVYEGRPQHLFAVLLLPRKQSFVHDLTNVDGLSATELVRTDATLPNPTQKVASYLVVNADDLSIDYADVVRSVAGRDSYLIPDGLLRCTTVASSREVLQQVATIVEDVAEEYGMTTAVVVSQAKAAVAERVEIDEGFSPVDVGETIFEDRPDVRERFEQRAREERLPEEVPVRRGVANRVAGRHRIRTDTGIELSFPSDATRRPGIIDFSTDAEGYVTITLSGIAHIENR